MSAFTEEERAAFQARSAKINAALDIVEAVFKHLNQEMDGELAFICMVDAGAGGATSSNVDFEDGVRLANRCLRETAIALAKREAGTANPNDLTFQRVE